MNPNPLEQLTLEQLRTRTSMKWRAHPADVLPLWVAEMDVNLAPTVAAALHRAVDNGDTGYPYGTAYAEALAEFAALRWQWHDLEVGRTAIVPDVMMGIVEMLRLVTDRGDTVIVNSPVYAPFYAFVSHDGRRVVEAPLGTDGRIDLDALEEAFAHARRAGGNVAYLLCNPHNPTGAVHSCDELRGVAERARRYDVRVVSDEIHAPLVFSGARFTPYLTVPGSENALSLTSATKAWNLGGVKAALAVAVRRPPPIYAGCRKRSATGRVTWASLRTPKRSEPAATGLTRCWPDWTQTARCRAIWWTRSFPGCGCDGRRAPTWPGWTVETSEFPSRMRPVLRWCQIYPGRPAGSSITPEWR